MAELPPFPELPAPIAGLLHLPGREWPAEARTAVAAWVQQNVLLILIDRWVHRAANVSPDHERLQRVALEAADRLLSILTQVLGPLDQYQPSAGTLHSDYFFTHLEKYFSLMARREEEASRPREPSAHNIYRGEPDAYQGEASEPSAPSAADGGWDDSASSPSAAAPSAPRPTWPPHGQRAPVDTIRHGDAVEASVFGSPRLARGDNRLVQVFVHRAELRDEARAAATEVDETARRLGYRTLGVTIAPGTELTFVLEMPRLQIADNVLRMVWTEWTESVAFAVTASDECPLGMAIGTLTVAVDSVPIGHITFQIEIVKAGDTAGRRVEDLDVLATNARRYRKAFISYASQDRNQVLARVQMLQPLGVDYFQDVMHLSPGDRWAKELYRHIDACDVFYLFWSSNAKASEWVLKELRYAYELKHHDEDAPPRIQPIPIEGPPPVQPPTGFEWLHVDDPVLYFRVADQPDV